MKQDDSSRIVLDVLRAEADLRAVLGGEINAPEILDRTWSLQDRVHRLVAHVADNPQEISELKERSPRLIQLIVDTLSRLARSSVRNLAAIQNASAAINDSLFELQRMKDATRNEL